MNSAKRLIAVSSRLASRGRGEAKQTSSLR